MSKEVGKTLQTIGIEGISQTQFYPQEMRDRGIGILENVHDWCISRQLVWGHRIPVWYNLTTNPSRQFLSPEQMNQPMEVELDGHKQMITGQEMMVVSREQPSTPGE
jgi:valyl-tRNA synthetase